MYFWMKWILQNRLLIFGAIILKYMNSYTEQVIHTLEKSLTLMSSFYSDMVHELMLRSPRCYSIRTLNVFAFHFVVVLI